MNALPSPPPHPQTPRFAFQPPPYRPESTMDSIITSVWHLLDQTPPPTLREVLEAYKTKGDGDREMLIAMLNAKSAEDQRLASVASLHRTMLDIYHAPARPALAPLHIADPQPVYPAHPLPAHSLYHSHVHHDAYDARRRPDAAPAPSCTQAASEPSRKRRRASPSPAPRARHPTLRERYEPAAPAHDLPLPPSPYSSASSHSSGGSPRSRGSMTIGSLLSNSSGSHSSPPDSFSAERSTTGVGREKRDRRDRHA